MGPRTYFCERVLPLAMVRLDPMTEADFAEFRPWMIADFARAGAAQGMWTEPESIAGATKEIESLLPKGLATPDHYLRIVRSDESSERVGTLWYARRSSAKGVEVFVYWIGIDEAHRRHGFASAVFTLLEEEARRLGASAIALHVFGDNLGARALYERLGFRPTNLRLSRPVGTSP